MSGWKGCSGSAVSTWDRLNTSLWSPNEMWWISTDARCLKPSGNSNCLPHLELSLPALSLYVSAWFEKRGSLTGSAFGILPLVASVVIAGLSHCPMHPAFLKSSPVCQTAFHNHFVLSRKLTATRICNFSQVKANLCPLLVCQIEHFPYHQPSKALFGAFLLALSGT